MDLDKTSLLGTLKMSPLLGPACAALAALIAGCIFGKAYILDKVKAMLKGFLMNIRHIDGHVMPGVPWRWTGYFSVVNFFGPELKKSYGRVYHVWDGLTPIVILSDVAAIKSFYKDHFSHKRISDITCFAASIKDVLGESIGMADGKNVRAQRSHFEPAFTTKASKALNPIISQEVDIWIKSLPVGESLDLMDSEIDNITLKVVMHTAYGKDTVANKLQEIKRLFGLYNEALAPSSSSFIRSCTSLFPRFAQKWPSTELKRFTTEWEKFHDGLLEEREKGVLASGEGLFFVLSDHIKAGLMDLSYKQLLHSIDGIVLLNIDITFAAVSFVIYDISKYPDIQEKLRREIDSVLSGHDPMQFDDLEAILPYLNMVIKESARMHPTIGVTLPEVTVKEVTDMAGYQVPKGTRVSVDPFSINYDETYWPNPDNFNPERFAAGQHHVPYSFFRFGLGPRKCMGYRLAHLIIQTIVVKLLQNFNLELADPSGNVKIKTQGAPISTPYLAPNIVFRHRNN